MHQITKKVSSIKRIVHILNFIGRPWKDNWLFFLMMYILGCVVAQITIPHYRGAHLYANLYTELFFDVSVVCVLLSLIPGKVRGWVQGVFAFIAYAVALVDVYCFVTYDTTLTPTVMMLLAETNSREAGEFLQTVFSPDIIFGKIGYILLIAIAHVALSFLVSLLKKRVSIGNIVSPILAPVCLCVLVYCADASWANKPRVYQLLTAANIGEIEHILTEKEHGEMYQPIYRLAFSAYANSLTAQQIRKLQRAADEVRVDSCSFTSPNIVLIIGESYSRHHSHQYGYWQPTTPCQEALERTGRLVPFTDVIAPWNLTSFVFKLMFSTYSVGDEGEWCDYPLFPELFKAAGYHVTFLTNQFLPKAREAVYDFSGGFFLNDAKLSAAQFDARNDHLYKFDEELLSAQPLPIEGEVSEGRRGSLSIYHLSGQHVLYSQRSPDDRKHFKRDEYKEAKPHLNARERQTLADYDNAILYNDSVVAEICKKYDNRDAIVIYVPDHGEECYEGNLHFYCRMHSATITSRLAHAEFDIPFWIYCTEEYTKNHPEIFQQVTEAKDKRYMTDALPHLLLYLAGIHSKEYKPEQNILAPEYNEHRPRILKNTTDYDTLD